MNRILAVLLMLNLFIAAPVLAQEPEPTSAPIVEVTPEPVVIDEPIIIEQPEGENPSISIVDVQDAVNALINTMSAVVLGVFGTAPITTVLVAVLKIAQRYLPDVGLLRPIRNAPAPHLTFGVAGVLWVLASAAALAGVDVQFKSLIDFLTTTIPALSGFIVTLLAASRIYKAAKAQQVAIIGYSRTPNG